jgi:CRISPR-associated protein Csb1
MTFLTSRGLLATFDEFRPNLGVTMSLQDLMAAQALRSSVLLEPIDGAGGRIFPPTYPAAESDRDKKARHVVERLPNGQLRVLVDSVASQANRQEAALVAARNAGTIKFSDVYVDLSKTAAGLQRLSATEMPHRLSDAILRDSEIDRVPFGKSEIGRAILTATAGDLTSLIETSPTSLVFGCWFSQHGLARQFRIQRSTTSEIWADNAVLGQAVGSRIDPLGIEKLQLYATDEGDWTALEAKAQLDKGKAKQHPKKRPSEVNHGNIAPSIREQGITAESITLKWAMPMAAIRRLRFGGGYRDAAGQGYVVALGVLARVLDHQAGYSLRSRCDLISAGPVTFDVIGVNGEVRPLTITTSDALALLVEAEGVMTAAGIKVHQSIQAQPGQKLVDLIEANRKLQEAGGDTEEEAA